MKKRLYFLIVLLVIALVKPMAGWEGSASAEQEAPAAASCPATFGPIITDTAIPIEKGRLEIQPIFSLSFTTDKFNSGWQRVSSGGDFQSFGMSWKLTYGLINDLEVYTVIPYIHNWAGNADVPGPGEERSANSGGLGDITLTFKYRLVAETEALPTVSAIFTPTFPSGQFRDLNPAFLGTDRIGRGAYGFTPGLNLSKYVAPFIFYGNFWYSMQTAFTSDDGRQYPRDYVTINLAAEYPFTSKWVACLELTSYWDGSRLFGHQANVPSTALLSLAPEIEYMATDKFSVSLGVNFGLTGKNTTANITPLFSMIYAY